MVYHPGRNLDVSLLSCIIVHIVRVIRVFPFYSCRHVITGLFFGTVFYNQSGGEDFTAYNNRLSLFFFSLLFVLMSHLIDIANMLQDRPYYYRERSIYDALAYWLSITLVQIPFNMVNVALYSSIMYYLVGLRTDAQYFFFFLYVMWVADFVGMMVCQILACLSSSAQVAVSLFPISLFFCTAFEGFIVYIPSFPPWLGWLSFSSYLRYAFQALVLNEFYENSELPQSSSYIGSLGFESLSKYECANYLWIFVFLGMGISCTMLRCINFEKR